MTVSVRITSKNATSAGGQNAHDLRRGAQPDYVDSARSGDNSVVVDPMCASELRKVCETRRSVRETKRGMKSNASIATVGVLTFGKEAQKIIESLPVKEQNERIFAACENVAFTLNTTLTGLVIHRDESAIHAHFQMPAVRLDGHPISKKTSRNDTSKLQDIVAVSFEDLDIFRGEKKQDKIKRLDGEGKTREEINAATIHRSVRQLHEDLPFELEKAKKELAEQQRKIDKNKRLIEEQEKKLQDKRVEEETAQKRIDVYARRVKALEEKEAYLQKRVKELFDEYGEIADELRRLWDDQQARSLPYQFNDADAEPQHEAEGALDVAP